MGTGRLTSLVDVAPAAGVLTPRYARPVSSLTAFRGKLERDRRRAGLSVARLSWQLGMSVRAYPELVEGETWPSYDVWERIEEFSGWPRAFVGARDS
jgi:hypothetical protein